MWNFNQPPMPLSKLQMLQKGMSKRQVILILGEPTTKYDASSEWAYSRLLSWPIVYIYFDKQGRFKEHRYDY